MFGHAAFRGQQADIVSHVAAGGDALVLMPTGGGKSLCYQLPGLLREGTAVVISPLIALMADQVAALKQLGVRAAFLNSSQDAEAARATERALRMRQLDLLYVAPERLLMPRMLELLDEARLALFAIDEAHCVSQWGHDFRPEYLQLSVLQERFPKVPRIALTATADPQTRTEILRRLGVGADGGMEGTSGGVSSTTCATNDGSSSMGGTSGAGTGPPDCLSDSSRFCTTPPPGSVSPAGADQRCTGMCLDGWVSSRVTEGSTSVG